MRIRGLMAGLMLLLHCGMNAQMNYSDAQTLFIYNFLKLIQWPSQSVGDNFVIGVYGNSNMYEKLSAFTANRVVGNKAIVVKKITSLSQTSHCQLLYVPGSEAAKVAEIKKFLGNTPCLIVSEKENANKLGAGIEFVVVQEKLKFRINETVTKQQNIIISQVLIDMAI